MGFLDSVWGSVARGHGAHRKRGETIHLGQQGCPWSPRGPERWPRDALLSRGLQGSVLFSHRPGQPPALKSAGFEVLGRECRPHEGEPFGQTLLLPARTGAPTSGGVSGRRSSLHSPLCLFSAEENTAQRRNYLPQFYILTSFLSSLPLFFSFIKQNHFGDLLQVRRECCHFSPSPCGHTETQSGTKHHNKMFTTRVAPPFVFCDVLSLF